MQIMGVSRFLKEKNPAVRIVGVSPAKDSKIPGIADWPAASQPKILDFSRIDERRYVRVLTPVLR